MSIILYSWACGPAADGGGGGDGGPIGSVAALIVGSILFVWIYPSVAPLDAHGTGNYMDVWGMLIVAPWLLGGAFVAGALSYMIVAFTARRREEAEIAALLQEEEGR